MKFFTKLALVLCLLLWVNCSGKKDQTDSFDISKSSSEVPAKEKASTRIDLVNKGIGPITEVKLEGTIDEDLAKTGEGIYKQNCLICHKPDTKFIGPAPKGILDRRTPEWIMNMILEPGQMLKNDPLAKDLFMEFNGSPMSDMNLTTEQARAVLEYFRTL